MIFFFILSPFLIPILLSSFKNMISHIKIFFKDLGKFLKVSLYFCKFQKYEVTCGILLAKKRRSVSTEVCLLLSRKSNFFFFPSWNVFFFHSFLIVLWCIVFSSGCSSSSVNHHTVSFTNLVYEFAGIDWEGKLEKTECVIGTTSSAAQQF